MGGMSSTRSPLRLLRGGVAATVATAVALSGHVIGGGEMPTWIGILVPWWLSVAACSVLAGSRFSLARMSAAVLTSQALFHGLFAAGTVGDGSVALQAPPGKSLGHHAHAEASSWSSASSGSSGGAVEAPLHASHSMLDHAVSGAGGWSMIAGHLVAAALTIILLQRGEALVLRGFGLARSLLLFLRPALPSVPGVLLPAPLRIRPGTARVRRVRRAVLSPRLRRGPPVLQAA